MYGRPLSKRKIREKTWKPQSRKRDWRPEPVWPGAYKMNCHSANSYTHISNQLLWDKSINNSRADWKWCLYQDCVVVWYNTHTQTRGTVSRLRRKDNILFCDFVCAYLILTEIAKSYAFLSVQLWNCASIKHIEKS